MKAIIKVEKEVVIKTLQVEADVRYWEDATVNGVEDSDGTLIPCRKDKSWCPIIDIDSGKILNWKQGAEADIHYKVCDAGSYFLKDENGETLLSIENDYVPSILCPDDSGYGDYIIMKVQKDGQISNWNPTLDGFIDED